MAKKKSYSEEQSKAYVEKGGVIADNPQKTAQYAGQIGANVQPGAISSYKGQNKPALPAVGQGRNPNQSYTQKLPSGDYAYAAPQGELKIYSPQQWKQLQEGKARQSEGIQPSPFNEPQVQQTLAQEQQQVAQQQTLAAGKPIGLPVTGPANLTPEDRAASTLEATGFGSTLAQLPVGASPIEKLLANAVAPVSITGWEGVKTQLGIAGLAGAFALGGGSALGLTKFLGISGLVAKFTAAERQNVSLADERFTLASAQMDNAIKWVSDGSMTVGEAQEMWNEQLSIISESKRQIKELTKTDLDAYLSGGKEKLVQIQNFEQNILPHLKTRMDFAIANRQIQL